MFLQKSSGALQFVPTKGACVSAPASREAKSSLAYRSSGDSSRADPAVAAAADLAEPPLCATQWRPNPRRPRRLAPVLCTQSAVARAEHLARTAAKTRAGGAGLLLPAALTARQELSRQ